MEAIDYRYKMKKEIEELKARIEKLENKKPTKFEKEAILCSECKQWIVGGCSPGMSCY